MCICLAAVIISGCSDKGKSQKDSNPSGQDFVLTEEQKNYLSDKKGIGTAALELMNKESINWNLLGTGFELYNKTSGVETNGVEYIADTSYDYQHRNALDRKITFDEAVSFRNEDTKMRIEALSGYRYEINEAEEYRKLQAPISGYDDTYLTIFFKVSDNKVFMKVPYIEPANPPKEIVNDLNALRDLLLEYVFYCHQYMDRMIRNKEMVKTVSIVSDTDSSFISLDAWYNYNIQYLKDYDCPIMHQQIDVYKFLEEEKKRKDYFWADTETPEWYNAIDNRLAIKTLKVDSFGDIVDQSELAAIEFLDDKKDYDFFSEEIINQRRAIDATKIIPQDNVKFALINIMCYILSSVINKYMIDFTKESGSYRGDAKCKINMKNEFYMSRIMLTDAKKHYASLQILQEGNYLGNGVLDVKGIDCLTKSSTSKDTQKALKKILLEDMLTGNSVDQLKLIKDIAILEKTIYNDLLSGSKKY